MAIMATYKKLESKKTVLLKLSGLASLAHSVYRFSLAKAVLK